MILNIPSTLSQIRAGNLRVPLQFNADLTSQYDPAKTQILSNGTSGVNLLLGVSTSGFILLKSGITNLFAAGSAQGVQNQNSWGVGVYGCNVGGSSYSGFSSTGLSDILGNVPTGSSYKLFVQGVEKYRLGAALCELDRISLGGVIGSSVDPGAGSLGLGNIQFTQDSSALASSSKTQAYSDGNAGSLFVRVPTAKMVQGLVNSNILLNLGRSGNALSDTNWSIGKYGSGSAYDGTAPGITGIGSNMYYNVATGGVHQFFLNNGSNVLEAGGSFVRFLSPAGTEQGRFDSAGLTLIKNLYWNGVGSASSTYTTQWADAANGNLFTNVPTGKYEQHRVAGQSILKLGNNGNGTAANYWEIGDSTGPSSYVQGSGANMVHYAASIYYESTTHRFCNTSAVESARITASGGFIEAGKISLGGTIGSSVDPGSGGIYTSGNVNVAGTITLSGSTPWINTLASGTGVYLQMGAGSANISTIITYTNAYDGGTKRGSMELLAGQVAGASIRVYDKNSNQQLDISEAGCVSVRQNSGGRTANFSATKYFNSYFWGHTNTEYLSTIGAFNSGGQPFIAFYAYHSTTTNTLARASATNVATWLQADTTGYISFFQGNTGTVDGNITGTEKYRFGASLLETSAASFGGTIGSSVDPGAGGIYATGNVNFRGGQKAGVSTKTTTYTATSSDYIILGNHASTPFTINLPAATGSGQVFIIKNINTAAVTVDANASETIDGSLTQVLATNNSITIVDYATGLWAII